MVRAPKGGGSIMRRRARAEAKAGETDETHFGYATVPLQEKQGLVDDVFHKVASRYDLMNDLMSMGVHRAWKDALVSLLRPPRDRPFALLDVAGGTGDIAFRVLEAGGPRTSVTVLDVNGDMLAVGRDRAGQRYGDRIEFVQGNAEVLPLADASFDAYTIAFGIRNVPRMDCALAEAYRVLRRGGRFLCLEFSTPDMPVLDRLYDAYSFTAVPALGKVVTGDGQPYRYLVESIRQFPSPAAFSNLIASAGFGRVSARPMTGGIVQLHSAWKL
jgi:demethylmenaquinone methyltransferase/2-methoxy-6-polyprenyl-1,4-benzoquinol methylase